MTGRGGAPGSSPPAAARSLLRFDGVERAVHWANAALFAVLVLTGAALYFAPLTALVGRRVLVERVHVVAGLVLPVPVVLALAGSWGRGLRRDLARLNHWSADDRRWLRTVGAPAVRRRVALRVGKFNAGQKLNAAFTAGGGLVMLGTGCLLRWYRPFPLAWRSGATLVHNWLAAAFVVVITGHVLLALSDTAALRSMLSGRVGRDWAGRHAPEWLAELDGEPARRTGG
ncbi:MAG TPA: cytochrome b/b6 domain-containing protein [Acidimicrobiales bacterium]|nr:cytochrome b/b6 domain-containing protein [Acidimicrobiales bacterium]